MNHQEYPRLEIGHKITLNNLGNEITRQTDNAKDSEWYSLGWQTTFFRTNGKSQFSLFRELYYVSYWSRRTYSWVVIGVVCRWWSILIRVLDQFNCTAEEPQMVTALWWRHWWRHVHQTLHVVELYLGRCEILFEQNANQAGDKTWHTKKHQRSTKWFNLITRRNTRN